jgi:omega-6 fatty acid desaturase (delta-12 desaturase)
VLFVFLPGFLFLVGNRVAGKGAGWRWHRSVLWTNLALLAIAASISALIGWRAYLLIQVPVMALGATAGVWLFYVQHQFDGVYWEDHEEWDYLHAALRGSSYYKLPRVLQWLTGNIGFHHVHHLGPRIPNYLLEKCHRENSIFHGVKPLRLWESLKCMRFRVWDKNEKKLVGLGFL